MDLFRFQPGETPVLLSIPHVGTAIPPDIAATFTDTALRVPDTDWHLDRLYHFAPALGIGYLAANLSRYAIDLNREPGGRPLYPGADNTELCPLTTFEREPVYQPGREPDAGEVARRLERYWRPYHRQLAAELEALHARFGIAILFEAHSIRSEVPRFFPGRLPDFNLGTSDGTSADPALAARLMNVLNAAGTYSAALNGRFKGGYITRHYGAPDRNIHAVQLELSQITYMDEAPPFRFRTDLADRVRPTIERLMAVLLEWARERSAARKPAAYF